MDDIIKRLDEFIADGDQFCNAEDWMIRGDEARDCQYWISRVSAFLRSTLPESSLQYREAVGIARASRRQGGLFRQDISILLGHLKGVRDAVEAGDLRRFEDIVAAGDLMQFLDYSRAFHDQGKKVEASVIACAVFEDSVRRIADAQGIDRTQQLDTIISALQTNGVINKVEAKKLRFFAGIRNAALHASWGEFELTDVEDLIAGTDDLVATHLGSTTAL